MKQKMPCFMIVEPAWVHQTLVAMHLSFFFEPGLSILDDVNVFLSLVTWIYPITVILTLVSFLKVNKHLLY